MFKPYLMNIDFNFIFGKVDDFFSAAEKVTSAHREHKDTKPHFGYVNYSGGQNTLSYMVPLESYGELDSLPRLDAVVEEVYGDKGVETMKMFRESASGYCNQILQRDEDLSTASNTSKASQYIYKLQLKIDLAKAVRFNEILAKIGDAHKRANDAYKYHLYTTIAGDQDVYTLYIPFDKFVEIEKLKDVGAVLTSDAQLKTETYLTQEFLGALKSVSSCIVKHLPELSNVKK
jgi:hypothetical protein